MFFQYSSEFGERYIQKSKRDSYYYKIKYDLLEIGKKPGEIC
jgi:hypothetical protein